MRQINSKIDTGSSQFATNRAAYEQLVATLRERQQWAIDGGPGRDRSIERHLARGKVMVRDRIDMVIDDGTPFLELSTLSGCGQYDDAAPGAGIVTGIGLVHGVPWMFIANDATVKGGSLLPVSIKKHVRAQEIAERERSRRHLPGRLRRRVPPAPGRDLPRQGPLRRLASTARPGCRRMGLPQLSVVLGGCTAGRRVRSGAVRRGHHGRRHRPDLPGRSPDREGGPRRDRRPRRPRRRRAAHPDRPASATTSPTPSARPTAGSARSARPRTSDASTTARAGSTGPSRSRPLRPRRDLRDHQRRRPHPLRLDRDHRPHRRRLAVLAVQARVGRVDRLRLRPDLGSSGRHHRQQRASSSASRR